MPIIQEQIHKLEVGGGMRFLRIGLVVLVVLGIVVWNNFRNYKNMSNIEAMDAAQLGRNIAQGKGYTTMFVRPLSMYLLRMHNLLKEGAQSSNMGQLTRIKDAHPDIAN